MKAFRSVIIVKHPREQVWTTIRDRLPEVVPLLDDIRGVSVQERQEGPGGSVRLVNVWHAQPILPAPLASAIDPDLLAWTDRAEWNAGDYVCHWRIEPHFFPDRTQCAGRTHYETAIGGRGTRITFEGELAVDARALPHVPTALGATVSAGIESFVTTLVPKNFRKLTTALSVFLGQEGVGNEQ